MIVGLALLAAVAFGGGVALQERAAAAEPLKLAARPTLLLRLVRRPLWVLGLLGDIIGFGLQALALRRGSLVVVQPLITTSLLFTLAFIAVVDRVPITRANWLALVGVLVGLSAFLVAAQPTEKSRASADATGWMLLTLSIVVVIGGCLVVGLARHGLARAAALAFAAGTADAFMAVLAKAFAGSFDGGVSHLLASWTPYALTAGGVTALLLTSTAYQARLPTVTLPIITVTDPLLGCVIGIALFGEQVRLEAWRATAVVVALGLLAAGLVSLGRDRRIANRAAGVEVTA